MHLPLNMAFFSIQSRIATSIWILFSQKGSKEDIATLLVPQLDSYEVRKLRNKAFKMVHGWDRSHY